MMKKYIKCWFFVVGIILTATQVLYGQAGRSYEVTPKNISDPELAFKGQPILNIKCTASSEGVKRFRVIVTPRSGYKTPTAKLSIYQGSKLVASTSVAGLKLPADSKEVNALALEQSVVFEFEISNDFLPASKFEIRTFLDNSLPTPPFEEFYWFSLYNFGADKPPLAQSPQMPPH